MRLVITKQETLADLARRLFGEVEGQQLAALIEGVRRANPQLPAADTLPAGQLLFVPSIHALSDGAQTIEPPFVTGIVDDLRRSLQQAQQAATLRFQRASEDLATIIKQVQKIAFEAKDAAAALHDDAGALRDNIRRRKAATDAAEKGTATAVADLDGDIDRLRVALG